ncbi:MAG: prepilin-type N-terminal cleavage/methylation domain-containing protein [Verrucomicrobiota bacterium]
MSGSRFTRLKTQAGFNLIEVSLAIAICSIGLIALLGLIPTGIDASRRAADDTLAASLASDVLHWRRISPYTNSTFLPYGSPPLNTRANVQMTTDAMGNFGVDEYNNTNLFYTGAYFLTTYTVMDNPLFPGALDAARVVISVEWPALSSNRTKRVFVSDYARWQ